MTFNICAVEGKFYADRIPRCEIEINDYLENCYLITDLWNLENYRNPWQIALQYLYEKKEKKCMLITDINKKRKSAAICYWALFAEGNKIYIQEIFNRDPDKKILLNLVLAEKIILDGAYDDEIESEYKPSEWVINFEDIAHLAKKK